jgi:uncharacterized membrane protein
MPIEKRKLDENKENPYISIAKAVGLLVVVFFLLFAAFFTWSAYNHMYSKAIDAMLLDTASDDFIILTKQEINNYPALLQGNDYFLIKFDTTTS